MNKISFAPALVVASSLVLSACQPQVVEKIVEKPVEKIVEKVVEKPVEKVVEKVVAPTAAPNPDRVINDVEKGATITFWTFFLSPTFDGYIKKTIDEFQKAYPEVTVKWEDHQGKFLDEYRAEIAAGKQPDVANLSGDWIAEFAEKGLLMDMDAALTPALKELYFPDIYGSRNVGGKSYGLPWYQSVGVNLVSTDIISKAGFTPDKVPTDFNAYPEFCKAVREKAGTPCGLALGNNILRAMAYQGDVKVMSDDGKTYTFDNAEGVKWLQTYADMVKSGSVVKELLTEANDRVGLDQFAQGKIPFWASGPQLVRVVREANPGRYGYIALVPGAAGKSGKYPPSPMFINVAKGTKFPKASLALAQWFTNPRNQLEFAKIVPIYPATPKSYDDPFFAEKTTFIENSVRPIAKSIIANQKNIMPDTPKAKEVNDLLKTAFEQAVLGGKDPAAVLKDAATKANALLK